MKKSANPCPICRRSVERPDFAPFCSSRCRALDLSRWLDGDYRLPVPITERDLNELEEGLLEQGSTPFARD
ncbi:MAG: DNA gyrase inhibitor YacG [Myxococcota bacterium]|nr:DNA gyrase inhibitor YacG [Myxococcota bacterium]